MSKKTNYHQLVDKNNFSFFITSVRFDIIEFLYVLKTSHLTR